MFRPLTLMAAAVLGVAALTAGPARADVLYTQPTAFPDGTAYSSQNAVGGLGSFALVYDDFTLAFDAEVTSVSWQGQYFNPPERGDISAFMINIYSTNAGEPGTLLESYTIAGNANETLVSGAVYNYQAALGSGFTATAGTRYWIAIQAQMPFPPQWGWYTGTGGNGVAFQDFFGNRSGLPDDLAFTLEGQSLNPVPLPAGAVLFGLGMASLSGARLIRRRKAAA